MQPCHSIGPHFLYKVFKETMMDHVIIIITIYLAHANMKWEKDLDQMDMIVLSPGHWFLVQFSTGMIKL